MPITFVERELGDTKMSRDIVVEALWRVTAWGVGGRATNRGLGPQSRLTAGSSRTSAGPCLSAIFLIAPLRRRRRPGTLGA